MKGENRGGKKQIFIRGDLNDFYGGIFPLRNPVWISLLRREYGGIYDGVKIWLYEKTKYNGKEDVLLFPGIIKDIGKSDEYEILVSEHDMEYLSERKSFPDYSADDIIGMSFEEEKKRMQK